jgi:hypothetical protein
MLEHFWSALILHAPAVCLVGDCNGTRPCLVDVYVRLGLEHLLTVPLRPQGQDNKLRWLRRLRLLQSLQPLPWLHPAALSWRQRRKQRRRQAQQLQQASSPCSEVRGKCMLCCRTPSTGAHHEPIRARTTKHFSSAAGHILATC